MFLNKLCDKTLFWIESWPLINELQPSFNFLFVIQRWIIWMKANDRYILLYLSPWLTFPCHLVKFSAIRRQYLSRVYEMSPFLCLQPRRSPYAECHCIVTLHPGTGKKARERMCNVTACHRDRVKHSRRSRRLVEKADTSNGVLPHTNSPNLTAPA